MDLLVASLNVPGHFAPRTDTIGKMAAQVTLFQVNLNADTTLTPLNLTPGEYVRVRMVQDSAGGHTVTWVNPPTYDGDSSLLVPATGAGVATDVYFTVRSDRNLEIVSTGSGGGGGGGGGGTPIHHDPATLVVGGTNVLSGSYAGPAALPPATTAGDQILVLMDNNAHDVVVNVNGSDRVNGLASFTLYGSGNPWVTASLEVVSAGVWSTRGSDSALPAYVAPLNTAISMVHAGASTTGPGNVDQFIAENAKPGTFSDGGGHYFRAGDYGDPANHAGPFTIHLGLRNAATITGPFNITDEDPTTHAISTILQMNGANNGGIAAAYRGGTFDWGANSGAMNWQGAGQWQTDFPVLRENCYIKYHFDQVVQVQVDYFGHVQTAVGTPVAIGHASHAMFQDEGVCVTISVTINEAATNNVAFLTRRGTFNNPTGSLSVAVSATDNGGQLDLIPAALVGVDAGFSISTFNVAATVTGVAGKTLDVTCAMVVHTAKSPP